MGVEMCILAQWEKYRDLKTKLDLKNLTAHDRKKNVTKSLVYATSAI